MRSLILVMGILGNFAFGRQNRSSSISTILLSVPIFCNNLSRSERFFLQKDSMLASLNRNCRVKDVVKFLAAGASLILKRPMFCQTDQTLSFRRCKMNAGP